MVMLVTDLGELSSGYRSQLETHHSFGKSSFLYSLIVYKWAFCYSYLKQPEGRLGKTQRKWGFHQAVNQMWQFNIPLFIDGFPISTFLNLHLFAPLDYQRVTNHNGDLLQSVDRAPGWNRSVDRNTEGYFSGFKDEIWWKKGDLNSLS